MIVQRFGIKGCRELDKKTKPNATPLTRYPHTLLGISYIAEQSYCEKRVDLWLDNPGDLVSVPAQARHDDPVVMLQEALADHGTAFHESVADAAQELKWDDIRLLLEVGCKLTLLEPPFQGTYESVPPVGRADAVCFDGLKATCVLEYKITDSNDLRMSHRVQLLLYGYLLEQQKLDVDDLILICVLVHPQHGGYFEESDEAEIQHFVRSIQTKSEEIVAYQPTKANWWDPRCDIGGKFQVRLRVFRYDRQRVRRELDFFIQYWLGQREPIPTTKPRKCEVCLYNAYALCPVAKTAYLIGPP